MHLSCRPVLSCVILAVLALLGTGCSPEGKKNSLRKAADAHYETGAFDAAEVEYLNLLKLDPQNGHAVGRLGLIYTAQGRTSRAIPHLMRGYEMQPNDLDIRLKVGQLYIASGKPAEARTEANFILDRNPSDPEAPSLLAATISGPEDAATVRQRLASLPAPAPGGAPVLTALASIELRLGRLKEADALLQQAAAADPKFAGLYSAQAALRMIQKDLAGAGASFAQAAALSPPRSPRALQNAQFKIRSGDVAGGLKLLEAMTQQTPDYIPAWVTLADISLTQNKLAECETYLTRALGRDTQNLEALVLQGRLHNLKNEPDKALALFEKLVAAYPRVPIIHQELGRAHAAKGDLTRAINSLNQAVTLAPHAMEAVMLLASLNSRRGDHNAAIVLMRKAVEQQPGLPQAQLILADAYRNKGDLEPALTIYRQLEQQDTQNPQPPLLSGLVLARQGKTAEARASFEKSFSLSPDSPVALEQMVNLFLLEKKYPEALKRVEEEIARNPKLEGFGQLLLAKVHLAQDRRELAEERLKRAIELMPDSATAYFLLAGIYSRTNQQEKALTQLTEVVTRNPKQVTALMLIGILHDQRGNFPAAKENYEKLLAVNPRSVVALNNLAYLYSERLNDLNKAHELAEKARQLAPNDPHNADTLGWILFKKRQYPWALSLLQEAADKLPDVAEIQFHLGITHYMLGAEEPAREFLQKAVTQDTQASWAPEARQALAILDISPGAITATAKPELEKVLAKQSDDPVALLRMAALLEREGKIDAAVSALESARKANPHSVNPLLSLARLHSAQKDSRKALELAKEARKLAPDDPVVAQSLGRLAYANGDFAWSASLLQEAVRRRADSPDLSMDLGLALYSVGRVEEAREAIRLALNLSAKQPLSGFSRSEQANEILALMAAGENASAAEQNTALIEQTLRKDAKSVPALMASGLLNEKNLQFDAAKKSYESALQQFPDFMPAKYRLVLMGASLKVADQKIYDWALQMRPLYPSDPLIAKTLGIQTLLKGDSTRALALLRESLNTRATDPECLYFAGLAQHNLKDPAFAKSLQSALDYGLSDKKMIEEANKLIAGSK